MNERELRSTAQGIIDANLYMVLGTADEAGRPWVSPVYFAVQGYRDFYWVSSPEATHSRNIDARPEVSIVVFDSQARIGTGQGVYMAAIADELAGAEVERGIEIFSSRSVAHGGHVWGLEDVSGSAPYRLYRAAASEYSLLDPDSHPNRRTPVTMEEGA